MKKCVVLAVLMLVVVAAPGQVLKRGSVIETSEITVNLKPDGSLDDYFDLLTSQLAPATAVAFPGTEVYFAKAVRGEKEGKMGAIWVFESVQAKNKFFGPDGQLTPAGEEATAELAPILEALDEIGTTTRTTTDWIVISQSQLEARRNYYEYLMDCCKKDNDQEVPVTPATMGYYDPLLQALVEEVSVSTSALIQSGLKEGDPQYPQYVSRIENAKTSLKEAVQQIMSKTQQAFQHGGSFGLHELSVRLQPGVTMDQFLEFLINRYIPEVEKNYRGRQVLIMDKRGDADETHIAWVNYFISEQSRDAYWPEPDTPSEQADVALKEVQSILFELFELGDWTEKYTTWLIE
ncbi:MAG: hypothetical protein ACWGNV_01245 [Bacteroidales bacterium]